MQVEVVRSARRRKTVEARVVDGVLRVLIPAWMSGDEERRWVDKMKGRFERRADASRIDLAARARQLAARFDLPEPASIRWVDNQAARWGSCSPHSRTIRMSSRLAPFPDWVIDYVLVHELAHLVEANHGRRFHELVARYPLAERAEGFLIAKGIELEGIDYPAADDDDDGEDEGQADGERGDGFTGDQPADGRADGPLPVAPALW